MKDTRCTAVLERQTANRRHEGAGSNPGLFQAASSARAPTRARAQGWVSFDRQGLGRARWEGPQPHRRCATLQAQSPPRRCAASERPLAHIAPCAAGQDGAEVSGGTCSGDAGGGVASSTQGALGAACSPVYAPLQDPDLPLQRPEDLPWQGCPLHPRRRPGAGSGGSRRQAAAAQKSQQVARQPWRPQQPGGRQ